MEALIAYLIVAAAAIYAAWQLMPQTLRRALIRRAAAIAPSQRTRLARLEADSERGACGSCKGCAGGTETPEASGGAKIRFWRR